MKPAKSIPEPTGANAPVAERPRALTTLVAIVDLAIEFRFSKTPSLIRRRPRGRRIFTRAPHTRS